MLNFFFSFMPDYDVKISQYYLQESETFQTIFRRVLRSETLVTRCQIGATKDHKNTSTILKIIIKLYDFDQ